MFNFQEYPFFRLILPFVIGIMWGSHSNVSNVTIDQFATLGVLGFGVVALTPNRGKTTFFTITLAAFLFWAGNIHISLNDPRMDERHIKDSKHNEQLVGIIINDPTTRKTTQFIMKVRGIVKDSQFVRTDGKLMVYLENGKWDNELKRGNLILLSTRVRIVSKNTNPHSFDYGEYLKRKKVYFNAFVQPHDLIVLKKEHQVAIQAFSIGFRNWVHQSFNFLGLDDVKISILMAMLIGDRKMVTNELSERFSDTGSLHLLAVSGLHVGIIILMFNFLFKSMGLIFPIPVVVQSMLLLVTLWVYACITGFSPSVMRASFMASIYLVSKVFNRNINIYNLIFFAALCLLFIDPYLILDAGFQFSFLALLGIVYFHKRIYKLIVLKNPLMDKIWSLVVVSIAAQALILPFSLFYFQKFSLYFWLSGVILVPYTGLIICLGFFTLFVGQFLPITTEPTTKILELVLSSFEHILILIQSLPGCAIRDAFVSSTELWLLNCIIFLGIILSRIKIRYIVIWALFACLLWNGYQVYQSSRQKKQARITFYDVPKGGIIDVFIGKNCFELNHKVSVNQKNYAVKGNRQYAGIEKILLICENQYLDDHGFHLDNGLLVSGNHSMFVLCKKTRIIPRGPVSTLIIHQNYEGDLERIFEILQPREIILDRSNQYSYVKRIKSIARIMGIPVWNIAVQGAKSIEL